MHSSSTRITRRRSSAGPEPTAPPRRLSTPPQGRSVSRPTYLTLRDHGKVFVADLPRLSEGQLSRVASEAQEVLESLNRRLEELEQLPSLQPAEQETQIRASTKRGVTERFLHAIEDEQNERRNNPALRAAAGESLARAFLEISRHRLPGATFDSLLQEALSACDEHKPEVDSGDTTSGSSSGTGSSPGVKTRTTAALSGATAEVVRIPRPGALPVVLSPDPTSTSAATESA
ncbi:hypothetical protein KBZ18_05990 [Synechococcus sp. Cruz-9H2]|uniref:hypothetical protein n=1 Tax=unclassified Synechococcus TaxID=2626047 RepID=UPI0020CEFB2B|nr:MULTISPECIES: hypothetical protein [unclassified Synechococcus]MCP9819038.1 hypothetical protein [Synechococcus sp. Cruz-9H2]MCP9843542.1 hypothetical protein [Synechococcus sp. Edmonson 11F2]MCP9855076.1 hypothetical protein [Synechococcus sp. Cruz-9C9]MCP9862952.1 hypothetical protein [Synechococcus sp. Cruz-7E5]MCP9869948.1 hypothetical protein [Synechococcus sp. Cruz-7B9]